jgi:hypothetical protein
VTTTVSHGFVWPKGLPSCTLCARMPNDPMHVTPSRSISTLWSLNRAVAASEPGKHNPVRPHAYTTKGGTTASIPCAMCGQKLANSGHLVGAPAGMTSAKRLRAIPEPPSLAREEPVVIEGTDKLVLATRAAGVVDVGDDLDEHFHRELASIGGSPHLWIAGRYVAADSPNRNGAYWSTADLEMGEPTVANGPVNWLHEGRHVIGAIAGSQLVTREHAAEGEIGTHIVALGAVWPWLYPDEAAMIQQASEAGSLWFSMECISREVACLAEGCEHTADYRAYMLERETARCEHMNEGAPRRFVDPIFQGVGIIVPPVRPGWAEADARVTQAQTEQVVLREAAAFQGVSDADAMGVAYTLLNAAERITAP